MNHSRRTMMKWALGAAQVGLLDRFGLLERKAWGQSMTDVPSRFCVLYVPGGWRPQMWFWGQSDAEIDLTIPDPSDFEGEPVFFRSADMVNLAPGDGQYPALRLWRSWDPVDLSIRANGKTPAMYGFVNFGLASQASVLHGIDQGTNDHASGFISSMCGVAGADFRAPAAASVVANYLYPQYKDSRPLPFVVVTAERGMPVAMGLPSHAAPLRVPSVSSLTSALSDDPMQNPWWKGLNDRVSRPELDTRGMPTGGMLKTTALEEYSLKQPGKSIGRSNANVDSYLEGLHDSLASVSRVLATDVVTVLQQTKGTEMLINNKPMYLSSYGNVGPFGYTFGLANFNQTQLEARMDMTLRLLKSELATAVHVSLGTDFDTHNGTGNAFSCAHGRNIGDCVARFLGELKAAPCPGKPGKTLLDDTLVIVQSEFGRTWASKGSGGYDLSDNHHPFTSCMYFGGNVASNHSVGTYQVPSGLGNPVNIIEENGQASTRVPRSADAVTSALRIMGLTTTDFFIPGGYGEVVGLRKA
ncbi:MAG: DUF1501 domain-containing protein [Myxococcaceae bacterium]